jgi:hypothetical protein
MNLEALTDEQIRLATRLDAEVWFVLHGVLKDKEGKKQPKRLPNVMQKRIFAEYRKALAENRPCRILGLKPRQVGLSTIVAAVTYHHMRNFPDLNGALMADKSGTADKVFEIYRTFAEEDSYNWGPGNGRIARYGQPGNLADEIILPNGSAYRKETAGSARAGAGGTNQVANATEVAHFPVIQNRDPALGFLGTWAKDYPVSLGIWDTTPNGPSGLFYDTWVAEDSGYVNIFSAWFEFKEHTKPFKSDEEKQAFMASMDEPKNRDYKEREEMELWGVTAEQLHWRRETIKTVCRNDVHRFKQEFPTDPISCFLLNANLRFKPTLVKLMHERAKATPCEVGEISLQQDGGVGWSLDEAGTTRIWERPRYGLRYLVSMDTCTGKEQQASGAKANPDFHSIGVLRDGYTENGVHYPPKIVAHHYSRLEPQIAATIAAGLSKFYGNCMVIPEVNNCGLYHVIVLQEMGVNVFQRTIRNESANSEEKKAGWMTLETTRRTIIDSLAADLADWTPDAPTVEVLDPWITEQLGVFIKHKSGSYRAMNGRHDDGVMMLAIALYNRALCTPMKPPKTKQLTIEKINKMQGWRVAS